MNQLTPLIAAKILDVAIQIARDNQLLGAGKADSRANLETQINTQLKDLLPTAQLQQPVTLDKQTLEEVARCLDEISFKHRISFDDVQLRQLRQISDQRTDGSVEIVVSAVTSILCAYLFARSTNPLVQSYGTAIWHMLVGVVSTSVMVAIARAISNPARLRAKL